MRATRTKLEQEKEELFKETVAQRKTLQTFKIKLEELEKKNATLEEMNDNLNAILDNANKQKTRDAQMNQALKGLAPATGQSHDKQIQEYQERIRDLVEQNNIQREKLSWSSRAIQNL